MRLRLTFLLLSANACVPLTPPASPPPSFPGLIFLFPSPSLRQPLSVLSRISPGKGLHGGRGAENTTFLTHSLGKHGASGPLPRSLTFALCVY